MTQVMGHQFLVLFCWVIHWRICTMIYYWGGCSTLNTLALLGCNSFVSMPLCSMVENDLILQILS